MAASVHILWLNDVRSLFDGISFWTEQLFDVGRARHVDHLLLSVGWWMKERRLHHFVFCRMKTNKSRPRPVGVRFKFTTDVLCGSSFWKSAVSFDHVCIDVEECGLVYRHAQSIRTIGLLSFNDHSKMFYLRLVMNDIQRGRGDLQHLLVAGLVWRMNE